MVKVSMIINRISRVIIKIRARAAIKIRVRVCAFHR